MHGNVLIIDDVVSAGTSVRESIEVIRAAGATPCGVVIALDRMEIGQKIDPHEKKLSATQEVQFAYGIPVIAIATLDDLLGYLKNDAQLAQNLSAVENYRNRYGVKHE